MFLTEISHFQLIRIVTGHTFQCHAELSNFVNNAKDSRSVIVAMVIQLPHLPFILLNAADIEEGIVTYITHVKTYNSIHVHFMVRG